MLLATIISVGVFTPGSLALAGILSCNHIALQSGAFDAFSRAIDGSWHAPWLLQATSVLICYGALAWLLGPSRGLPATAHDGELPPFLQRTNRKGIPRNILLVQGVIVSLISCVYLTTKDVSNAFFLISAMTVSLYIIMYLLLYAAAIRLRVTPPELPRPFRIPGGNPGMWGVAGVGFAAATFAARGCRPACAVEMLDGRG
jgi:amino acid transporter